MSFGEIVRKCVENIHETYINIRGAYLSDLEMLNKTFSTNTPLVDSTNFYTLEGRIGAFLASVSHPRKEFKRMILIGREMKAERMAVERDLYGMD